MKPFGLSSMCFVALAALGSLAAIHMQESSGNIATDDEKVEDLREAMLGAWVLVGKPGDVGEPEPGARMKFWGKKHWSITQHDPDTGQVIFHHGGTYTLKGNKYEETIVFANESTKDMIGEKLRFAITVQGDTYTQLGDGNSFTEVWKRLKD